MEDFNQCALEFEDSELSILVFNLNEIFTKQQNNFSDLCTCVAKIYYYCKENSYKAKNDEYYDCYKLLHKFGFEKRTILRMVKCYNKFITGCDIVDTNLKSAFFLFSPSKLYILSDVSNDQLFEDIDKKIITPEMSVKELKVYVKKLKGEEKEENKVVEELNSDEDEIEDLEFYNPDNHYELDFFESCTKEQLIAIISRLQFEYEKLKKKK